jgi:hypothetical protein
MAVAELELRLSCGCGGRCVDCGSKWKAMELFGACEGGGGQRRYLGRCSADSVVCAARWRKDGKGSGVGDGLALAVVVLYSMLDVMAELKHTEAN